MGTAHIVECMPLSTDSFQIHRASQGGGVPGGRGAGLFGGIALALGLVGFGVYESVYNGVGFLFLFISVLTITLVEAGHRAIMFNRLYGVMPNIYPEGTHFRIPWLEWPIIYDCRTKPLVINSTTGSRGSSSLVKFSSSDDTCRSPGCAGFCSSSFTPGH